MKLISFLTKSLKNFLRIIKVDEIFYSTKEFWFWYRRDFTGNSPNLIKKRILRKLSNGAIWIETGTYYGGTARYLSKFSLSTPFNAIEISFLENFPYILFKISSWSSFQLWDLQNLHPLFFWILSLNLFKEIVEILPQKHLYFKGKDECS